MPKNQQNDNILSLFGINISPGKYWAPQMGHIIKLALGFMINSFSNNYTNIIFVGDSRTVGMIDNIYSNTFKIISIRYSRIKIEGSMLI